ncbi:MAG: PEP-CTERM sorting domain-containing protein [Planctomycetota bacterium]
MPALAAALAVCLLSVGNANGMQVTVDATLNSQANFVSLQGISADTAASGDGILHYSVRGDFDMTGDHGDPGINPGDERMLTFDLDGLFITDVTMDYSLPDAQVTSHTSCVFGEDTIDGIFRVPNAVLNDILSDGLINFNFGFNSSNNIGPNGNTISASLIYTVVPEPGTLALLGVSCAVCFAGRRRLVRSR